jgi:hypothetical protein
MGKRGKEKAVELINFSFSIFVLGNCNLIQNMLIILVDENILEIF